MTVIVDEYIYTHIYIYIYIYIYVYIVRRSEPGYPSTAAKARGTLGILPSTTRKPKAKATVMYKHGRVVKPHHHRSSPRRIHLSLR